MTDAKSAIAVTGATGRLGSALLAAAGPTAIPWRRKDFDLDRPQNAAAVLQRDRPRLVIHTAAMTDVDACARDPESAMQRNGIAVGDLARACHDAGTQLVVISTNEVFDGERTDGRGYVESDQTAPRNPYGTSKLAGEVAAREVFDDRDGLWIIRTAWLYGPPGAGFPEKIVRAADGLADGTPLRVVEDEHGSPTLARDLAEATLRLLEQTDGGLFHIVNGGRASRLDWARRVLASRRPQRDIRPIGRAAFERASDPPPWGVLSTERAAVAGIEMRSWQAALADHLDGEA